MHVTRNCIVQGCEHETLAECYACSGRENHFRQMCFGRIDISLNVEERFDAFLFAPSLRVQMSVLCPWICEIWLKSMIRHGCNVCACLTLRGFARLVFDRGKLVCSL